MRLVDLHIGAFAFKFIAGELEDIDTANHGNASVFIQIKAPARKHFTAFGFHEDILTVKTDLAA